MLGLFREWDCVVEERYLCSGDILAIYTDGITEPFNAAGEQFGEERLVKALCRHKELGPQAMLAAVVDEVRQFSPQEQQDDITLIVGKCIGNVQRG